MTLPNHYKINDHSMEVARGLIPGQSWVVVRGHNLDIDSGAGEDIWEAGGLKSYLTSAETMNVLVLMPQMPR